MRPSRAVTGPRFPVACSSTGLRTAQLGTSCLHLPRSSWKQRGAFPSGTTCNLLASIGNLARPPVRRSPASWSTVLLLLLRLFELACAIRVEASRKRNDRPAPRFPTRRGDPSGPTPSGKKHRRSNRAEPPAAGDRAFVTHATVLRGRLSKETRRQQRSWPRTHVALGLIRIF